MSAIKLTVGFAFVLSDNMFIHLLFYNDFRSDHVDSFS